MIVSNAEDPKGAEEAKVVDVSGTVFVPQDFRSAKAGLGRGKSSMKIFAGTRTLDIATQRTQREFRDSVLPRKHGMARLK